MIGDSSDDSAVVLGVGGSSNEPDWEKMYASINPILFKTFTGKPMCFHFKMNNYLLRKKYEDIVVTFGGVFSKEYRDVDYKTAIMVEDYSDFRSNGRPMYRIAYIVDCITKNSLLDIEDYEHEKGLFGKSHFMDVFFWEKEISLSKTSGRWHDGSSECDDLSLLNIKTLKNIDKKQTRDRFTRSEQEDILKYIVLHTRCKGLRGSSVWKTMEKRKVCPKHTYQSMKNHFLKHLLTSLDKFEFLSEKQKKMMRKLEE